MVPGSPGVAVEPSAAEYQALATAIRDLDRTFGREYPRADEFLQRVDRLRTSDDHAGFAELRREALIANPLVTGRPILFVVRNVYHGIHGNMGSMFQVGEINEKNFRGGGAIKTVNFAQGGRVTTLLNLTGGVARDPDVHFSGTKVLFSMRRDAAENYHLWEMRADGTGLQQLTQAEGTSDIDPIYLPDDTIVFSSTREPKYCMCNRHIMANLYRMEPDGANIRQIGKSTLFEGRSSLTPDGRILYDRWEYVDRNFGDAQGLWTANPDGTNHAIYWGNNTNSPGGVVHARIIPGAQQAVAVFTSCHDQPWGAIAIIDRRRGLDGGEPVVRIWPPQARDLIGRGNYDTFKQVQPKYQDPYPLSEKYFLCSRQAGARMGIFLIDVFGNEVLLHAEGPGCFDPMPLGPRRRPPAVAPRNDLARPDGDFYVADVYRGTGMDSVRRGTVKHLRVVESPEKRTWTQPAWDGGTGQQAPGMAWDDFNNKRVLGTVPVEEDGSAYFSVPADTFVYFQLLDGRGMMIQSMRSGTIIRPGETIGCVGCHDNRRASVPTERRPAALRRPASRLASWYGPARKFGYLAEVQPVLDKHCVACHDHGKPAGKKLNLAGDLGLLFNTSYVELRRKKFVTVVGAGPHQVLPPKSWGSYASRLTKVLAEGHGDPEIDRQIKLDREGFDRIVTWIDLNAPYYPHYASAYRNNRYGRSPLDNQQLEQLQQLTGSVEVSFTRPELSPCLERLTDHADPKYQQALSIIIAGKEQLTRRPRADMPGFQLVDQIEIDQEAKYQARLKFEVEMRAAITTGQKKYDE
jgi:hypothetical protein